MTEEKDTKREKLLLFGGKPIDFLKEWEITTNLPLAEKKLGVSFETVKKSQLRKSYQNLKIAKNKKSLRSVKSY
ncbi:hypothetical protein AKJ56_02180 [candidate division MSBL1 archaeon SCGC-AAA382N08]|uniref:Uncharacterized protein n=1 Tax=candidate division MSBL1 archaeon SCGC-AAA382N08 TaxID=1698285 RepID=A0A133VN58_9EURY|nr:hypothetical protein AKJ56_02180 [candidate division MSBL1 archaeon SCGC-AAA382N08]